ncbi:hypothetical protein [Actinophytocola sp.]|uniref:hypothetical protein n=1 Tax=Actinophytocola sp. TaxID=1872138 RepID=UPI00389A9379
MPSKQSIRRWLWNAPPTAGFWLAGVALIVATGGAALSLSPVILKVIAIVLGVGLGLFALVLISGNRDFKPESWSEYGSSSGPMPPTDSDGT